jgi:hypothetical protein
LAVDGDSESDCFVRGHTIEDRWIDRDYILRFWELWHIFMDHHASREPGNLIDCIIKNGGRPCWQVANIAILGLIVAIIRTTRTTRATQGTFS